MLGRHRVPQYLIKILLVDAKQLTIGWKMETRLSRLKTVLRVNKNSRGKFIFFQFRFPSFSRMDLIERTVLSRANGFSTPSLVRQSHLLPSITIDRTFHLHNRNYQEHETVAFRYIIWQTRGVKNQESHNSPAAWNRSVTQRLCMKNSNIAQPLPYSLHASQKEATINIDLINQWKQIARSKGIRRNSNEFIVSLLWVVADALRMHCGCNNPKWPK